MYVYIAGPYSKGDVGENVRNAVLVADEVSAFGHVPYIPHLTHLWHMILPHEYEFWMDYDFEWLKKCDCLIRLSGESKGADEEVRFAKKLSIPVYDGIYEWKQEMIREKMYVYDFDSPVVKKYLWKKGKVES